MKPFRTFLVAQFILTINCFGQWQPLGTGLDNSALDLYYDSVTSKLFVAGGFTHAGGVTVNGIATWDGISWDSVGHGSYVGGDFYSVSRHQNKIFASGIIYPATPGDDCIWNATWNGLDWDTTGIKADDPYRVYKIFNGNLYVAGAFQILNHSPASCVARYDGNQFYPYFLPVPRYSGASVNTIEFYNNQMYVGGNIYDTVTGQNDLERWNGTSFEPFGNIIFNGFGDAIQDMVVFQNELYIGGGFHKSTGSPGDNLIKWDGTSFTEVGGGVNSYVYRMKVYNNELYITGGFSQVGGLNIPLVAKWDGSQWSSVISNFNCVCIRDFEFVGNDMYIIGGFDTIGNVHFHGIAKYPNVINATGNIQLEFIKVFPNPVQDHLTIELPNNGNSVFELYEYSGRMLLRINSNERVTDIDMRKYSSGVYYLIIGNEKNETIRRVVKI
jgi:trimeric autotransporter adhesin